MYDDEVNEEIGSNESAINPEMWVFSAVSKSIEALSAGGDRLEISYMKFIALVNVAEAIAEGQGYLSVDYEKNIKSIYQDEKYKGLKSGEARNLYECTKKLKFLSKEIGNNKNITSAGKLGKT